jgi:hypothetical protein
MGFCLFTVLNSFRYCGGEVIESLQYNGANFTPQHFVPYPVCGGKIFTGQ